MIEQEAPDRSVAKRHPKRKLKFPIKKKQIIYNFPIPANGTHCTLEESLTCHVDSHISTLRKFYNMANEGRTLILWHYVTLLRYSKNLT